MKAGQRLVGRMPSCALHERETVEPVSEHFYFHILNALGATLHTLQPFISSQKKQEEKEERKLIFERNRVKPWKREEKVKAIKESAV